MFRCLIVIFNYVKTMQLTIFIEQDDAKKFLITGKMLCEKKYSKNIHNAKKSKNLQS